MAGYKGAGLALILGLLAGTLNGALFGRDCVDFNAAPDQVTNTGQFVLALDPARFQPLDRFKAEVDRHIRSLRSSKALPGAKPCGCRASSAPNAAPTGWPTASPCRRNCWCSSTDWRPIFRSSRCGNGDRSSVIAGLVPIARQRQ